MAVDGRKILRRWLSQNNAKDYQKHIATSEILKKNSIELVEILNKHNILCDEIKIFEIGCGCGRNLAYIDKEGYNIEYFGNDLVKEECFKYMDEVLKNKITFFEKETAVLFKDTYDVDLFISSDHMMHLIPKSIPYILDKLKNNWKPKYILLRETVVGNTKGKKKKWAHDYSILDNNYKCIHNGISKQNDSYPVILLERKERVENGKS